VVQRVSKINGNWIPSSILRYTGLIVYEVIIHHDVTDEGRNTLFVVALFYPSALFLE
jgi:hypothetical protein